MSQFIRSLVLAVLALVTFSSLGFAGVDRTNRVPRPRFGEIVVVNGSDGDADRAVRIVLYHANKDGKVAKRPCQRFVIDLAGGGEFVWSRARFGRYYAVEVFDRETGEQLAGGVYRAGRDGGARTLQLTGTPDLTVALVAELREQITVLNQQVADLEGDLTTAEGDVANLLAQIALLNQRIADLEGTGGGSNPNAVLTVSGWQNLLDYYAVAGDPSVRLASARVRGDQIAGLALTELVWSDEISEGVADKPSFGNFTLWDGNRKVAGPVQMNLSGRTGTITFALARGELSVGPSVVKDLVLIGESFYGNDSRFGASVHTFHLKSLTASTLEGWSATISGGSYDNQLPVARTYVSIGGGTATPYTGRARASVDRPIFFGINVDAAGPATVQSLTVLMSQSSLGLGAPAVPSSISSFSVALVDAGGQPVGGSLTTTAQWDSALGGWVATFDPAKTFSAGSYSSHLYLQVNSTGFANSVGGDEFAARIVATTWSDGVETISGSRYESGTGVVVYE